MGLIRSGPVWVVSPSDVLSAAVAGGLSAIGWTRVRAAGNSQELPGLPRAEHPGLVLVADEHDDLPTLPASLRTTAECVVAIANHYVGRSLGLGAERDVDLVDAGQSLQAQLRDVDRALLGEPRGAGVRGVDETAWTPLTEVERVATLTPRESQVLDLLMSGITAGEIATCLVISLPTVRAHIRAIMRKLAVSSQLAAVAVACRSTCGAGSRGCQRHMEIAKIDDAHFA